MTKFKKKGREKTAQQTSSHNSKSRPKNKRPTLLSSRPTWTYPTTFSKPTRTGASWTWFRNPSESKMIRCWDKLRPSMKCWLESQLPNPQNWQKITDYLYFLTFLSVYSLIISSIRIFKCFLYDYSWVLFERNAHSIYLLTSITWTPDPSTSTTDDPESAIPLSTLPSTQPLQRTVQPHPAATGHDNRGRILPQPRTVRWQSLRKRANSTDIQSLKNSQMESLSSRYNSRGSLGSN